MKIIDRNGIYYETDDRKNRLLRDMYSSPVGRGCMKVLTGKMVSRAAGIVLESRTSAAFVERFAEANDIDLYDFEKQEYDSFNDFFTRRVKKGHRLIDRRESALVCPCDGNVTAYSIAKTDMFVIKNTVYSTASLLRDKKLAAKFAGGAAVIVRLSMADAHRYVYPCDGIKSHDRHITGGLGVTRPVVNEYAPVFKENTREYCMIRSEVFGDIIQMEIGSLGAGRIRNFEGGCAPVKKGEEKGVFDFGGSTVLLLLQPGRAGVCTDLIDNTRAGLETRLRMGEVIATALENAQ